MAHVATIEVVESGMNELLERSGERALRELRARRWRFTVSQERCCKAGHVLQFGKVFLRQPCLAARDDIAFARVNDWELLSKHDHLRRITVGAPSGPVSMPAPAPLRAGGERTYGPIPALGEHTETIRREFLK